LKNFNFYKILATTLKKSQFLAIFGFLAKLFIKNYNLLLKQNNNHFVRIKVDLANNQLIVFNILQTDS